MARRALWLLALCSACATSYVSRAPPSPAVAWEPPSGDPHDFSLPAEESPPLRGEETPIDPGHVLGLPELIDIAESTNPDTRIAWQRARQAALDVGLAKAEYLPTLSAVALGGYRHTSLPVRSVQNLLLNPTELAPGVSLPVNPNLPSRVGADTYDVLPFLAIRWQLLHFGRGDGVSAAEHASDAANVAFTGQHQKVVLDVTRAYLRLGAARAQTKVARDALERTRGISRATEARLARGLATTVAVAEGHREVAQGEYALVQAEAAETALYTALLSTMGIDPLLRLNVATSRSRDLPEKLVQDVDEYLHAALKTRPDLQAAVAARSSAEALVKKSEATFLPRMNLVGTAGAAMLGARIDGGPFQNATLPNIGAMVTFDWLLFDGGVRSAEAEKARSRRDEAEQTIVKLQNHTEHEVVAAYNEVNAGLSRYHAASALEKTAAIAEDATTRSYSSGLSTLTDTLNAQKARSLASAAREQAFADALISAATLAFASGQLGGAQAVPELRR